MQIKTTERVAPAKLQWSTSKSVLLGRATWDSRINQSEVTGVINAAANELHVVLVAMGGILTRNTDSWGRCHLLRRMVTAHKHGTAHKPNKEERNRVVV